jgi:hypothetical protein
MPYRFLNAARNVGSVALNHAKLLALASSTAGRSLFGRIGQIRAISSSSAYSRATSRRNASPFRRLITDRNAVVNTRSVTASGVGGGKGCPPDIDCCSPDIRAIRTPAGEQFLNELGYSRWQFLVRLSGKEIGVCNRAIGRAEHAFARLNLNCGEG